MFSENHKTVSQDLLESNDMVARLHGGNAFANGLHNACAFMPKYDWEGPFWIFA
jgi:hypothetical protein